MPHPRPQLPARRLRVGSALAALVLACTACSGADLPAPVTTGSPSATAPTAPGSSLNPGATPTPSPTATPSGDPPASGPIVKLTVLSVRAPEGFTSDEADDHFASVSDEDECTSITAMETNWRQRPPLEWLARNSMGFPDWTHKPKRLSNVTIAGRTWYLIHGEARWSAKYQHIDTYQFGVFAKKKVVMLRIQFDTDGWCGMRPEAADRKSVLSSILATARWR